MELRPSSASSWSRCAGYPALNAAVGTEQLDELDTDVREDGTACHWLAAELWEGRSVELGAMSPNGREITEEMFAAVDEYHALLRSWNCPVTIERQAPVSTFFPGVSDGTPDAWAFDGTTLFVGDLKFGFRPVEVWRNAQLGIYAWTLLCMLTAQGHAPQRVRLSICQPRCPHRDGTTRDWSPTLAELAQLAQGLVEAALRCHQPDPPCTVGPQCRSCPAAHACQTLQAAALGAAEISYGATPFVLNTNQLGYELAVLMAARDHLDHRLTGLTTQAESLLRKGNRIPGFELARAATRWRWREGTEAAVKRLGELFGVEVMQPPKVKSVAQLRNAFPSLDVQDLYAEKPAGEMKLKPVDPNEAIKRFGK